MTSPENEMPGAAADEHPAEQVPQVGAAPGAPQPPVPPRAQPAPVPPPAFVGPPQPGPWLAPPRQVWINPQKRTPAILAAIAAALILLVVGGVIGAEINGGGSHDRHVRMVPGNGYGRPFGPFAGPGQGRGDGHFPEDRVPPSVSGAPSAVPRPSGSSTS